MAARNQPAAPPEPDIIWEDPPTNAKGRKIGWVDKAPALQERQGQWGIVQIYAVLSTAQNHATRVRNGDLLGDGWDARAVKDGDKGGKLYVRYVGTDAQ